MAATGKTPILLYGSTTPTNAPSAGNLTNSSDGCEIAINVADKNLFFKDSTNAVNTVPIRQSSASSNGWLSSTDWSTFNSKQPAGSYALTTGTLAQFASTTSAQLAGVISDETGSGSLVFATSPTFTGNTTLTNGSFRLSNNYRIEWDGATNSIYGNGSTNVVGIYANNIEALKITGSTSDVSVLKGNLVIGTSGKGITTGSAIPLGLGTNNGVSSATIHNSGGVSIGNTTDPGATNLSVTGKIGAGGITPGGTIGLDGRILNGYQTSVSNGGVQAYYQGFGTGQQSNLSLCRFTTTASTSSNLIIGRSRSTTPGSYSAVTSGDYLGVIFFTGDDSAALQQSSSITAIVDGTVAAGSVPARLLFSTTPAGSGNPVERMTIDSKGNIYPTSGTTGMTNGFFYIPAAAGAPSGTPTAVTGRVPMYYDSTNNNFYVYNGAWKKVTLT